LLTIRVLSDLREWCHIPEDVKRRHVVCLAVCLKVLNKRSVFCFQVRGNRL
jgi:hypothetical protein